MQLFYIYKAKDDFAKINIDKYHHPLLLHGCFVFIQNNENNTVALVTQYNTKLEERTLFEGYCSLEYGSGDSWITAFQFNISNDCTQFTDSHTVYIYQSACQTFNNDSGNVYFTLQVCYSFQMKTRITDNIPTS